LDYNSVATNEIASSTHLDSVTGIEIRNADFSELLILEAFARDSRRPRCTVLASKFFPHGDFCHSHMLELLKVVHEHGHVSEVAGFFD